MPANAQDDPPTREQVGVITVPGERAEVASDFLAVIGRLMAWGEPAPELGWNGLVDALSPRQGEPADLGWTISAGDEPGIALEPRAGGTMPLARAIAFDVSLDCNAFRAVSPQPFSRSVRGRALDALTIDNARRARLTGIFADPDDTTNFTLVLFTESRSESPGRWHARPIATVGFAENRGDPEPPHALELDFGELWEGVLLSAADFVLGQDPACEAITSEERLREWGRPRVGALRSLGSGLDGRVWVWAGSSGDESFVVSLPLSRGTTDRRVADNLRAVFGRRLAWSRDPSGRAIGTLAMVREDRAAEPGDRALVLRFITIAERTSLTIAKSAADLDGAVETLADIPQ